MVERELGLALEERDAQERVLGAQQGRLDELEGAAETLSGEKMRLETEARVREAFIEELAMKADELRLRLDETGERAGRLLALVGARDEGGDEAGLQGLPVEAQVRVRVLLAERDEEVRRLAGEVRRARDEARLETANYRARLVAAFGEGARALCQT